MEKITDIKKIQERLLSMAVIVRDILESSGIKYFITYGTLLGAVRHGGFIPWDDDFDIYLFDEEYDRAIELLRENLPADLFLEDELSEPKYFHGWAHIKDDHSIVEYSLFPGDDAYFHKGLSLDLYRAYLIKDTDERKFRANEHLKYIKRKCGKGFLSIEEFNERSQKLKTIIREESEIKHGSGDYVYTFPSIYNDRIYPEELFPLKKYEFSDTYFLGPANADVFLKRCYGDYMSLPPEEKRKPHYSSVVFL